MTETHKIKKENHDCMDTLMNINAWISRVVPVTPEPWSCKIGATEIWFGFKEVDCG